jgi:spermidine synthase
MDFSAHCRQMLNERGIALEWAERAVSDPDRTEDRPDGTRHYLKQIPEHGHRWLRVVISDAGSYQTCVTVFFDRRLRKSR